MAELQLKLFADVNPEAKTLIEEILTTAATLQKQLDALGSMELIITRLEPGAQDAPAHQR